MQRRVGILLVVAVLLPAALAGSGCGGDDSSKGDSPPAASAPSRAKDVPKDAGDLKARCVKEAQQITGQSKGQAEKTCTVPKSGDVDKAVNSALKSCLSATKGLPAGSEHDQAVQDCKDSVK